MSLFQSKVWWTTKISASQEFDAGQMAVGRFGTKDENSRIVVGGFDGYIRIYEPKEGGFRPSHMVLEKEEGRPILQLSTFKFAEDSAEDMIAVLYSRGFTVYGFHLGQEGLLLKNEARDDNLDRVLHNMCACFVQGEGILCIQSQDGLLFFYNKSTRLFTFQLHDIVVPSPLVFIRSKNLLCVQNAHLELQAYRYNSIYGNTSGASTGTKPEWETVLGELALSFDTHDLPEDPQLIVGCEQHIYVVRTNSGKLEHLKRLQCVPSAVLVNNFKLDPRELVLIVSSFSHHILFYKNFELVWATKTANVAHGIKLGTFSKKKGLIVTLNDEGHLDIIYLGVDVPELKFQNAATREQSYDDLKKEALVLKKRIQAKAADAPEESSKAEVVSIKCQINLRKSRDDGLLDSGANFASEIGSTVSSALQISLSFSGLEATNISLTLSHPEALLIRQNHFNVERLKGKSTPVTIETDFTVDNRIPLTEQFFEINATYDYMAGPALQTGTSSLLVPISLQTYCYLVAPVKEADFKLTVEASSEVAPLNDLFRDFIEETAPDSQYYANPNVLSFLLNEGSVCTLIVAKNSNKLRVQGNNFDSLYLLMNELVSRQRLISPAFKLRYSDALPFKDFFDILEERSNIAQSYKRVSEEMAQKSNQLLLIQKRLLTRYKEKNSAPLNHLDFLLESSISDLMAQTKEFENLQLLYKKNSQKVAVSFKIFMGLLGMRFNISDDGMQLLQKYLPSQVEPAYQEVGWVEIVDTHIFYLLRNVLMGKEEVASTAYNKVDSLQTFQQHFTLLVDKISKGLLENYRAPKETSVIASKL